MDLDGVRQGLGGGRAHRIEGRGPYRMPDVCLRWTAHSWTGLRRLMVSSKDNHDRERQDLGKYRMGQRPCRRSWKESWVTVLSRRITYDGAMRHHGADAGRQCRVLIGRQARPCPQRAVSPAKVIGPVAATANGVCFWEEPRLDRFTGVRVYCIWW